ncbi:saccharopine dehydrogenase NADP-binding domain-containing protein [Aliamphritea spongicola]|uniref:saccharopine dehydrogenase NADP-binding domain-containing protein n=1 Tax=Aliamphritea spongicola TaxID=707589 RepID=UPI00196A1F7C|nr:saccharopine dehydrogenase NADP-binding domain-containing protein [Aliamphritea spongicola]MBN3563770.1 saccharopine dehydrogenase NADP-binding domain-containing protein [Aliamphritea spongicola]
MTHVLIIGGYGNFGLFISQTLAKENGIKLTIAGRSKEKAEALVRELQHGTHVQSYRLDISEPLQDHFKCLKPDIVIHTSGPFQKQGYDVAQACIDCGAHYIDLADGREFVSGITALNTAASENNVLVVSGASSVPGLTSAIVDKYLPEFSHLESLDYGITTAQKTTRGLATTAAILGYTGKPVETLTDGKRDTIYGWQGLRARNYPLLGWRLLGNCDIPDLTLFPERYPGLQNIRFYAGLEIPLIHITLWLLSWGVRFGLIRDLSGSAPLLLRMSFLFDWLGTANSAFHMQLSGTDHNGDAKKICFELTARSGDGPFIPCMPAILLTRKLLNGELTQRGAQACTGLITLDEYLNALGELDISWTVTE